MTPRLARRTPTPVSLDLVALEFDSRLRPTLSIIDCVTTRGRKGETENLLSLAGLRRLVGADRAVLVKEATTSSGREVARHLGIEPLDAVFLERREAEIQWVPPAFGPVFGHPFLAAQKSASGQTNSLGAIPPPLIRFLLDEAYVSPPHRVLSTLMTLRDTADSHQSLPQPLSTLVAAHALCSLISCTSRLAGTLASHSVEEVRELVYYGVTTGRPDGHHVVGALTAADAYYEHYLSALNRPVRRHRSDESRIPSVVSELLKEPEWIDRLLDAIERYRARPEVARGLPQTADLVGYDALLGGDAWTAPSFDHLFTVEHKQLVVVTTQLLRTIIGPTLLDPLIRIQDLRFDRSPSPAPERYLPFASGNRPPEFSVRDSQEPLLFDSPHQPPAVT